MSAESRTDQEAHTVRNLESAVTTLAQLGWAGKEIQAAVSKAMDDAAPFLRM